MINPIRCPLHLGYVENSSGVGRGVMSARLHGQYILDHVVEHVCMGVHGSGIHVGDSASAKDVMQTEQVPETPAGMEQRLASSMGMDC
jgi:hypothetical protein